MERPNIETGPSITTEEVANAIRKLKNNKAAGPDKVYADLLKLIEQNHLDIITELFNITFMRAAQFQKNDIHSPHTYTTFHTEENHS